jgi:hypothetical protein
MHTPQTVIEGVLDWVRTTLPELEGGYDHVPTTSDQPLPDVVVENGSTVLVPEDPRFAFLDVQQGWLLVRSMDVSFMVDDTDPDAAAQLLRSFETRTLASLLGDGTLGGRVPFVSPYVTYDYSLPFVERPDGTRGREMNMTMLVGELVEE